MKRFLILLIVISVWVAPGAQAQSQSAAELLEKGIYTEETVGDLDAAIAIYDGIVKSARAERAYVARALFRLGRCYHRVGKKSEARGAFTALVEGFGDQAELVAKAREFLPDTAAEPLSLTAAPWKDGEVLEYTVKLANGRHLGEMMYSARFESKKGREVWHIESFMGAPLYGIVKYLHVEADQDDFFPYSSHLYHTTIGRARTLYAEGERKMMLNRPGSTPESFDQKLDHPVFDNEQNIYIARRLKLDAGRGVRVPFTGRPGVTYTATFMKVGSEPVTVPAGTFECDKIYVTVADKSETYWITADTHRYVVKTQSAEAVLKLTGVGTRIRGETRHDLDSGDITITVPTGWIFLEGTAEQKEHGFAQVFAPRIESWGMFYRTPAEGLTARARMEKQIKGMEKKIKGYRVRKEGILEGSRSGLVAAEYRADFSLMGWKMTERTVCLAAEDELFMIVFVSQRDYAKNHEAAMEALLAGFHVNLD